MSNPDVIDDNTSLQDLLGRKNRDTLYQKLIESGNGNPIVDAYLLTKPKSFMPLIAAKFSKKIVLTSFESALILSLAKCRCPEFEAYDQQSMISMGENGTLPLRGYSHNTFCEKYSVLFIWSGKEYRLFSNYDGEQTEELDQVYANYVRWFIDPENPIQAITVSRLRTILPAVIADDIRKADQQWFENSGFEKFEDFYLALLSYQRYLRYFTIILDALFDERLENLDDIIYEKYPEFHADRKRELHQAYDKLMNKEEKNSFSEQEKADDAPIIPSTPVIPATPNIEDFIKPTPLDLSNLPEPEPPLSEEEIFELLSPISNFQEVMMSPSNLFTNYEFSEPLRTPPSPKSPEPAVEVAHDESVSEDRSSESTSKRKKTEEFKTSKPKKQRANKTTTTPKKMADHGEISAEDQLVASGKRCWHCMTVLAELDKTFAEYNTTTLCPYCSAFVSGIGKFIKASKRHEPKPESWAYFEQTTKKDSKGREILVSSECRLEIRIDQIDLSMKRPCKKACNMCHRKAWKIEKYREVSGRKTSYARDICYLCHLKLKHLDSELTRLNMEMASIYLDPNSTVCFDAFEKIRERRKLDPKDQVEWAKIFPLGPSPKNRKSKSKKPKKDKVVIEVDDIEEETTKAPAAKKQKTKPDEIEESEPFSFDEIVSGHELPLEDVDSSQEDEIPLKRKRKSAEPPSKNAPTQPKKSKSVEVVNGKFTDNTSAPVVKKTSKSIEVVNGRFLDDTAAPVIKKKKKQDDNVPVRVTFSDEKFKSNRMAEYIPAHYSRDNLAEAIKSIRKAMLPKPHRLVFQSIDECFKNLRSHLEKISVLVGVVEALEPFGLPGVVLLIEQLRLFSDALMKEELPLDLKSSESKIWELRLNYPHYSLDRGNSISAEEMCEKIFDVIEAVNRDAHESLLTMLFTL